MANWELVDVSSKYGFEQLGYLAARDIKKGEDIYACTLNCAFHDPVQLTRKELDEKSKQYPDHALFLQRYCYIIDHDLFNTIKNFQNKKLECNCPLLNHSCEPNCANYFKNNAWTFVALRDIKAGEEITWDYQTYECEFSNNAELLCKCGSKKCKGLLKYDYYRNIDWINTYYKYCSPFMQKRIDELRTKWYSSNCHVKRYNQKTELGLTALKAIEKDELIAVYRDTNDINEKSHFIRHNENPTCYLGDDGKVYALNNIEPDTELTLKFQK